MNKKTKLVLELLKTKASSLGFNKEELEGAATTIAGNLTVGDDATDEELNAAAEKAVAVYLPILELSQKNANRIIQKNKEDREKAEAEAKRKAEEEAAAKAKKKAEEEAAAKAEAERKAKEAEELQKAEEEGLKKFYESTWAKNMKAENEKLAKELKAQKESAAKTLSEFEAFRTEFNSMRAERTKASREKKLSDVLEGTGVFGERIKKNFSKMSFDTDEDFNEFLGGVQEDIKAFNQERADKGLDRLGAPAEGEKKEPGKVEPMSDAEADALAAIM